MNLRVAHTFFTFQAESALKSIILTCLFALARTQIFALAQFQFSIHLVSSAAEGRETEYLFVPSTTLNEPL